MLSLQISNRNSEVAVATSPKHEQNMNIKAFSTLSYGVYIVASGNKQRHSAFVATTVMQVTAQPAKIMVACNKNNFTADLIRETKVFSASVLKQNYKPTTMGTFGFRSGRDFDKFAHCEEFTFGENTDVPIVLEDCMSWFECRLTEEVDVGTHLLFIGEVLDAQITLEGRPPLTYAYYHEVKSGVTSKNAPTFNK